MDSALKHAPAHNAFSVKQLLADKRIPTLENRPYSPDLVPMPRIYLFPKLKTAVEGIRFQTLEEVKTKTNSKA